MSKNHLTPSIVKGKLPVMKQDNNNEFTQGRYKVEFPDDISAEEIASIHKKVLHLLERHSCKVVQL